MIIADWNNIFLDYDKDETSDNTHDYDDHHMISCW